MTMITPSYLGETIEYSSLHACRSTLEDPTSAELHPRQLANQPQPAQRASLFQPVIVHPECFRDARKREAALLLRAGH